MSSTYVINSPVLSDYGQWRFTGPLSPARARAVLAPGFASAIGHDGAARFLSRLLDLDVPARRVRIRMAPGDRALVLRLRQRLPEGEVLNAAAMARLPFELGLLERLS